jgi:hypothetical protein
MQTRQQTTCGYRLSTSPQPGVSRFRQKNWYSFPPKRKCSIFISANSISIQLSKLKFENDLKLPKGRHGEAVLIDPKKLFDLIFGFIFLNFNWIL